MQRDRAIARMAIRELAPVHLGALGLGIAVAIFGDEPSFGVAGRDTWPLLVLPVAASWGGMIIGGGSRDTLVHLLARPVSRLRVLAWRWLVLLVGLACVAGVLGWMLVVDPVEGPDLDAILVLTLLGSAFGAQGAALMRNESFGMGAAIALAGVLVLPLQLTIDANRLSWARVSGALGWSAIVPGMIVFAITAVPVAHAWSRALPARTTQDVLRVLATGLVSSLAIILLVGIPIFHFAAQPERGELLGVVAVSPEGPLVATGTRGTDGDRDVVDGIVRIALDGTRTSLWDRLSEGPDATVWRIGVPERWDPFGTPDTVELEIVEGSEPSATHRPYFVSLQTEIVARLPRDALLHVGERNAYQAGATYDLPDGRLLTVSSGSYWIGRHAQKRKSMGFLRTWEIGRPRSNHAVGPDGVWLIDADGSLKHMSTGQAP